MRAGEPGRSISGFTVKTPAALLHYDRRGRGHLSYFGYEGLDPALATSWPGQLLFSGFRSGLIIGADGTVYRVSRPRFAGLAWITYGDNIVWDVLVWLICLPFLSTPIWLRLTLDGVEKWSTEDVRTLILDTIRKRPDQFQAPPELVVERVLKAKTPRGMIGGMFRP